MLRQRSECLDIKEIRRQNFVATKDNSVATLIKENGSGTLSRQFSTLLRHKELKIT